MTYEQIYHEIKRDFREVKAYYDVQIKAIVSKSALKAKRYPLITQHSYTHPQSKNKYSYLSIVKKRSLRDNPGVTVFCEYEGKKGKEIITIAPKKDILTQQYNLCMCVFNAHFFKRYYERFLKEEMLEREKIAIFLIRNSGALELGSDLVSIKELEKDDVGLLNTSLLNLDGLCLGKKSNENRNIIIYKTFVSLSELYQKQYERVMREYIRMIAMQGCTDNPHLSNAINQLYMCAAQQLRDILLGKNEMTNEERIQKYLEEYNKACEALSKYIIL